METQDNLNAAQPTTTADNEAEFTPIVLPPGRWLTYGEAIEKYNLTNSFLSTKRDKIRRQGRYYSEDDIIVAVNEPSYLARARTRGQKNGNNAVAGFITKAEAIRKYKVGSSYLYARMKDGRVSKDEQGLLSEADVIKVVSDPVYQARSAARMAKKKKTSSWTVKEHKRIVAKEQTKALQEQHEPQERKDIEHYHTVYAAGWIASWIATYCAQSGDGLSPRDVTRGVCKLLLGS